MCAPPNLNTTPPKISTAITTSILRVHTVHIVNNDNDNDNEFLFRRMNRKKK